MLLSDLCEEKTSPDIEARDFVKDLRAVAKEKYQLTLDTSGTNASNGLPLVRKAGTWYGFKALPLGGEKAETKRIEAGELAPFKVRALAFASEVGARLEALAKSGRTVKLTNEISFAVAAGRYEKLPSVEPGSFTAKLKRLLADSPDLSIYWWVSAVPVETTETMANLNISIEAIPVDQGRAVSKKTFEFTTFIPSAYARAWQKLWNPPSNAGVVIHDPKLDKLKSELAKTLKPEVLEKPYGAFNVYVSVGRPPNASVTIDVEKIRHILDARTNVIKRSA